MPTNRGVEELIEQLKDLRLQGNLIREQEERVFNRLQESLQTTRATTVVAIPAEPNTLERVKSPRNLKPGDRVKINNSIATITRGRAETTEDRNCTVREITSTRRILITTDSGIKTWRYASNLLHLPNDQHE